ncbi:uncharacterized protein [Taeniopygia guttata]|uniref:uncharacterized protein n=1 Tax=Taeniopygia guttata TaxID=59729 RepID=UPI003BB97845
MSDNLNDKGKVEFYALLAKYNPKPSPGGEEWAQSNWFNLDNVVDRICSLQHGTRFKLGRNKTILCSVLGACLTAAVETRFQRRSEQETIIDSLQNLVEILQKQLHEERNEKHSLRNENCALRAALKEEHVNKSHNADSSVNPEEKETPRINQIYPHKELEAVNNYGEHCCCHLRPLIKTEYNYLSDDDLEPHITTKHIPYTATELAKLKKDYGRLPYESETEYVFRVSLTGGDQIKLTEQEASGYWGHGVFLTTGDKRDSWSLTQRAAFWAGGTNPLERGDPIAIISTPDQLLESVHKAACLQMIHEKKLIPGFESPMQLPVKPELMTPLIRGLPEILKPTAIALQKTIMTLSPVERLNRFLGNPTDRTGSTDPGFTPSCSPLQDVNSQSSSPGSNHKIWTWGEVAEDLINYCRKYGPIKTPEEKPEKSEKTKGIRSIGTPYSKNPEKGKQNPNRQHWWSLGVQKGVPREVMDGLPLDKLQKIITNWRYRKSNPSVQPGAHPSAPTLPQNMGKETTFSQSLPQNQGSGQKLTISQLSSQNSGCDPNLTFSQFLSQNPGSESSLSQPFPQNLSNELTQHQGN